MYNHQEIEQKWQKYWLENNTFKSSNTSLKPKYYVLDMFPYPSGAGLHVGHPEGYTANDIVARYKHAKGYNVLHPMGWDAFGLPAENYAIKTGTHPRITTDQNISNFKRQIQSLGFSYDWSREIDTTDPAYFKWTQWIFLKLYEHGLAYEQDLPINYCPSCKTGLANEEVLSDFSCERCGSQVEKKKIRQWVLAITQYAERLLKDVDDLDWPEGIKDMQRNWIGKSQGCEFEMKKSGDDSRSIRVYTTRVDTVFGMTYAVIAPDHPHIQDFIMDENKDSCEAYIKTSSKQSDQDRTADDKEKTGVFTGSYVVNPYNGESVPLWIADYVLGSYGTGAVMAVPAHDERDFEFAKKYDLPISQSIAKYYNLTGIDAHRDGIETLKREVVDVILENEKGEIFLIEENDPKDFHFIGGGIEQGDTEEESIFKETLEESGYTDIEILGEIQGSNRVVNGFRHTKQKNQYTTGKFFHVRLKSNNREKCEIDAGHHSGAWFKPEEVAEKITWENHRKAWELLRNGNSAMTEYGILVNSGKYDGLSSGEAKEVLTQLAQEQGFGHKKVNYKLRDWLFSRQRYWGEPIPLVHLERDDVRALPRIQSLSDAMEPGKAYVLKEDSHSDSDQRTLCSKGQIKSLVIDGKVVSKIYSGIYTDIICDYNLPLELPEVEKYEPAGDGNSPLVNVPDFLNVQLAENLNGKRETNTMPQWGGSCWYYLRFMDNKNPDELVGKEIEKYWGSVDSYVGGAEHAVLHLLYARFWHKFLFDIGVVSTHEPFHRLRNQGMILGMSYRNSQGRLIASDMVEEREGKFYDIETGEELEKIPAKMSKSLKNVINPDDIVQEYGADTLRMYEMYMADFKDAAPWDTTAIVGVRRFLDKVHNLFIEGKGKQATDDTEAMKTLHKAVKKIEEDIENYKFNTAIAQLMICMNTGEPQDEEKKQEWRSIFVRLLHPFAPHMAEEIWNRLYAIPEKFSKVYLATGNKQKVERLSEVFSWIDTDVTIESYPHIVEVEETGKDALECALQKLEPYKSQQRDFPILTADSAIYFEGQNFDPTHVRREALNSQGLDEKGMTQEEIADVMTEYYKKLATESGGKKDFYYVDAWALLLPNGEIKTYQYRREYILTNQERGERMIYFPMRPLYISKVTGKNPSESTLEDLKKEFACQTEAIQELFGYGKESVFFAEWPRYDEKLIVDSEVTIGVQVLGKLRGEITIAKDEDKDSVLQKARENENVVKWLEGKEIVKEIYVPGKIVNIVVK